jgi:hypothetical protein
MTNEVQKNTETQCGAPSSENFDENFDERKCVVQNECIASKIKLIVLVNDASQCLTYIYRPNCKIRFVSILCTYMLLLLFSTYYIKIYIRNYVYSPFRHIFAIRM